MTSAGVAVAGPNPECGNYFERVGERGKLAVRRLQEGLRKFATSPAPVDPAFGVAGLQHIAPPSPSLKYSQNLHRQQGTQPIGLSLRLLLEVARHVPEGFSTREVVKHLVAPLAQAARACMCDLPGMFPKKQLSPASVYTIHAWDAPFHSSISMLKEHVQDDPASFIYIDFLCSNLFVHMTSTERTKAMSTHLKTAPAVVLLISSLEALTRTWVLYQLWLLIKKHRSDSVVLLLSPDVDVSELRQAVQSVSIRHSMAQQEDKDAILADVLQCPAGASSCDEEVKALLLELLDRHENGSPQPDAELPVLSSLNSLKQTEIAQQDQVAQALKPLVRQMSSAPPVHAPASEPQQQAPVQQHSRDVAHQPPAHAVSLLRHMYTKLSVSKERLVGMVGQFDSGEKDYLARNELEEFIDFFMDGADPKAIPPAADALMGAAGGRITSESLLSSIKDILEKEKQPKGLTSSMQTSDAVAPIEAVAPKPIVKQVTMSGLANLARGDSNGLESGAERQPLKEGCMPAGLQDVAEPDNPPMPNSTSMKMNMSRLASLGSSLLPDSINGEELLSASSAQEGEEAVKGVLARPEAVVVLAKLNKIMHVNAERLVGMMDQFDEEEKEYLVEQDLVNFIDFFVDGSDPDDVDAVAAALCAEAQDGKLTFDNFHKTIVTVLSRQPKGGRLTEDW